VAVGLAGCGCVAVWLLANILHGRHRPHMLVTDRTTDLVINDLFLVDSPMCVLG
jgi:hypothetical protein